MALVWPARVPWRLNRAGAQLAYADARRRFETGDGPGRLRRRLSVALRPIGGAIDMSAAEHAWFEVFFNDTTRGGVLPFWFPMPARHAMPLLDDATGLPLLSGPEATPVLVDDWRLCQFGEAAPQPEPMAGGRMRVALSLVVLP